MLSLSSQSRCYSWNRIEGGRPYLLIGVVMRPNAPSRECQLYLITICNRGSAQAITPAARTPALMRKCLLSSKFFPRSPHPTTPARRSADVAIGPPEPKILPLRPRQSLRQVEKSVPAVVSGGKSAATCTMVYYFTSNVVNPSGFIYVGKDKFESTLALPPRCSALLTLLQMKT